MAVFLKGVNVKVLATTSFKTMIVSVIKVIAKVKIIAFLVVIFGSLLGSVPLWAVIAPLLLAFIAYQVASLPDKMGDKVSVAVRGELSGNFDKMNSDVVHEIMKSFTSDALKTLAEDIVSDLRMIRNLEQTSASCHPLNSRIIYSLSTNIFNP